MNQKELHTGSIMIVAGEASGDLHGAALVEAICASSPGQHFFGMGGNCLQQAGVDLLVDNQALGVMGFTEVFSQIHDIWKALKTLKSAIRTKAPSLIVLIDYAEFNLRLAKEARKYNIPVFYYITPKVWVWRKGRVKKLSRFVDRAGVILPFEEDYLRQRGVNATYVGNPALDSVVRRFDKTTFCQKYGIDQGKAIVGIIPGSRRKEVALLLPIFLEAARRMKKKYSRELVFVIPLAPTLTVENLHENGLNEVKKELDIHVITGDRYELMASCDAVVAASGTVTLELAILDVPMVVAYKFTPVSYILGKLLVNIPFFSLVNIIAEKEIVTELLQDRASPAAIELELARLVFDDGHRENIKRQLAELRMVLGNAGASKQAAKLAMLTMNGLANE